MPGPRRGAALRPGGLPGEGRSAAATERIRERLAASSRLFCRVLKSPASLYAFIAIILVVNVPFMANYYTTLQKDDWRGFASVLAGRTSPGDTVVVLPAYVRQPLNYYYSNASDGTMEYGAYNPGELQDIASRAGGGRIFYVLTPDLGSTPYQGDVVRWLQVNAAVNATVRHPVSIFLIPSAAG